MSAPASSASPAATGAAGFFCHDCQRAVGGVAEREDGRMDPQVGEDEQPLCAECGGCFVERLEEETQSSAQQRSAPTAAAAAPTSAPMPNAAAFPPFFPFFPFAATHAAPFAHAAPGAPAAFDPAQLLLQTMQQLFPTPQQMQQQPQHGQAQQAAGADQASPPPAGEQLLPSYPQPIFHSFQLSFPPIAPQQQQPPQSAPSASLGAPSTAAPSPSVASPPSSSAPHASPAAGAADASASQPSSASTAAPAQQSQQPQHPPPLNPFQLFGPFGALFAGMPLGASPPPPPPAQQQQAPQAQAAQPIPFPFGALFGGGLGGAGGFGGAGSFHAQGAAGPQAMPLDFNALLQQMLGALQQPLGASSAAGSVPPGGAQWGDYFFGDLGRLMHQLLHSESGRAGGPPTSAAALAALQDVELDEHSLAQCAGADCATCLEPLSVGEVVKILPCRHAFHAPDCIVPWLSRHNSCPTCRFLLPTDDPLYEQQRQRAARAAVEQQQQRMQQQQQQQQQQAPAASSSSPSPSPSAGAGSAASPASPPPAPQQPDQR